MRRPPRRATQTEPPSSRARPAWPEYKLSIAPDTQVLKLSDTATGDELQSILATLRANPEIEYAVADERRYAHAIPNDPLATQQWYFLSVQPSSTRAESAWDVSTGGTTTVVAVLDTGVRFEHPDLGAAAQGGKLLRATTSSPTSRWRTTATAATPTPSDPGDWVNAQDDDAASLQRRLHTGGRTEVDSSWHGTRVSSLIGALTNNATGMAGSDWSTLLLPVRVLGKCGGNDSDIIAGMRWAAGLP